jgi:hypothetical protein
MLNFLQMKAAWVPLPAPGAPKRISFIVLLEIELSCVAHTLRCSVALRAMAPKE